MTDIPKPKFSVGQVVSADCDLSQKILAGFYDRFWERWVYITVTGNGRIYCLFEDSRLYVEAEYFPEVPTC